MQWDVYHKKVGFKNGLPTPQPDLVESYMQRTFTPSIRQLDGSATLVHNSYTFFGLPHFAAKIRGYGQRMREAEAQTGYVGAHMVYARNKALEKIGDVDPLAADPPGRASPVTVACDGHSWTAYADYAHHDEDNDKVKYCQVCQLLHVLDSIKVAAWIILSMLKTAQNEIASGRTIEYDGFKRSSKILRNLQDWGRKESGDLRDRMRRHEERSQV